MFRNLLLLPGQTHVLEHITEPMGHDLRVSTIKIIMHVIFISVESFTH